MKILAQFLSEHGELYQAEVAAEFIVCQRCEGHGTHVDPNVDGSGLTPDDLADEDFREEYFRGDYDVKCFRCDGERVVPRIHFDMLSAAQRADFLR